MFVDDIKLYAQSEKNLKNMVHATETFSNNVGLHFGFEKCATAKMKKGKKVSAEPITLNEGSIQALTDTYKYLGVEQAQTAEPNKTKDVLKKEYFNRTNLVASSKLSAKNTLSQLTCLPLLLLHTQPLSYSGPNLNCAIST